MDGNNQIKTLAFVNVKTNGFKSPKKITEMCIIACSVKHFLAAERDELPRVLHKLSTCYNPESEIEPYAASLYGLNNALLDDQQKFQTPLLLEFLKSLPQPVSLISHNGNAFCFCILKQQLDVTDNFWTTLKCCDTRTIFRDITNNTDRKQKLGKVYKRLFNREPDKSLEAECDVKTLMKCAVGTKVHFIELLLKHQNHF